MAADWTLMMMKHGTFQVHVAKVKGFTLSIIGRGDLWHWRAKCDDSGTIVIRGTGHTLAAAKIVAEDAARRLADEAAR